MGENGLPRKFPCSALLVVLLLAMISSGCSRSSSSGGSASTSSELSSSLPPRTPSRTPKSGVSEIHFSSIPGGTVTVGSVSSEPGRNPGLERLIEVKIDSYDMSKTEITRGQWFPIMDPTRSVSETEANLPITGITWYEAVQFCELLTIKTGITHRLPTEPEWEHSSRGRSREMIGVWQGASSLHDAISCFHRGDNGKLFRGIEKSCNVNSGKLLPVTSFKPNDFELFDMQGNCWEWTALEQTLTLPPSPLHAAIRGGSAFSTSPLEARSANRGWQLMAKGTEAVGFRVVRVPEK
jgi:formylglycine-generating enzyme required for sulfatase activity